MRTFLFIFILLLSFGFAHAAQVFIAPSELLLNQERSVTLNLNTEDQSINAVEMNLAFSPLDFSLKDVNDGNSIVNVWLTRPAFSNVSGTISFSGIIPGGFTGASGDLVTLTLVPLRSGLLPIQISNARTLLNDGTGKQALFSTKQITFDVAPTSVPGQTSPPTTTEDKTPPEPFTPEVAQDPNFGGAYAVFFNTADKGSGIDHYEVREGFWGGYTAADSPYILQDQTLTETVYVRALDHAGNARTETVAPVHPLPWYKEPVTYILVVLVLLLLMGWRQKKLRRV